MQQIIFYLKQGLFHVLDCSAFDHIFFLIVLIVVFSFADWKKTLWLINFFTIGNTITLALSAYNVIHYKVALIEFLIVATIFITALSNMLFQNKIKKGTININLFFALFFGLIHGLGFSSYFKMLFGRTDDKIVPLFSFAIGVEVAQAIIVVLLLSLAFIFQSLFKISKRDWILVISAIVMGIILPLLKERYIW